MRTLLFLFITLTWTNVESQILSVIDDPDGYTNIREGKGTNTKIIGRIYEDEVFHHEGYGDNQWYEIYYSNNGEYLQGFVHKSRIVEIRSLPRIGIKTAISNGRRISNDSIVFEITIKSFEKDKHDYKLQDNKWVIEIDDNRPWGVDGNYPKIEVHEISLSIKGKIVHIPAEAYKDAYEFDLTSLNMFQNKNGTIFITSNHSDGAGYYELVWMIKNQKYKGRYINGI
jgi:hypothetical protein